MSIESGTTTLFQDGVAKTKDKDYYKKVNGRYVCRMMKDDNGMYKDEYRSFEDGRKYLVVYPYSKSRAEKHNFRELTLTEIENHFVNIGKKTEEMPKDFLLRKLRQLESEKEHKSKGVNA